MTRDELAAAGFVLSAPVHARLSRFVELLLRENRCLNLTAIRTAEDVWRLHICESLALLPLVDELRPRRLLDLGSGGGIPGIPLACVRGDLEVTLLDATRKKLEAGSRIVSEMGLNTVRTLWGRAEALAHDSAYRETFDAVTARAVAALPTLVEYAAGFLRVGGECWLSKSVEAAEREVAAAGRAASECGLAHRATRSFRLPGDGVERALVVYTKTGALHEDLPRRSGRARRRPFRRE